MNVGIVDIGSNTVRCVIYDVSDPNGFYDKVFDYKKMLQILNFIKDDTLSDEGLEALLKVLGEYKAIAGAFGVEQFHCFATASLRFLKNSGDVLKSIEEATGIKVDVISGEQEASLGYRATRHFLTLASEGICIDVGGGSTEIVYYQNRTLKYAASIPLGSLSLYLEFVADVFPTATEMTAMNHKVNIALNQIPWLGNIKVAECVGIGGSARAMTKVANELYKIPKINSGTRLNIKYLHSIANIEVMGHPNDARSIIKAVVDRSTTIIPGSIILNCIAKKAKASYFILSRSGIREGYLLKKLAE